MFAFRCGEHNISHPYNLTLFSLFPGTITPGAFNRSWYEYVVIATYPSTTYVRMQS